MEKLENNFNSLDDKLWALYSFARGAITRYHRLSSLNNRNVFSQSSGCGTCTVKVQFLRWHAQLSWGLSLWLADGSLLTVSSRDLFLVHLCPWHLSSCKDTDPTGLDQQGFMTSFKCNCLSKGPASQSVTLVTRTSIYEFCEDTIQFTMTCTNAVAMGIRRSKIWKTFLW